MAARTTNSRTSRSSYNYTYDRNDRNNTGRSAYVYGNTVRMLDVQRQIEEPQRKALSREVQVNRAKAKHMNLGYVLFLVAALATAAIILISYIRVQAEITTMTEHIAKQEKVLNNLRISNDEMLTRIESRLDMEEVKRVAIGELGMTYPKEGQIITYESVNYDYARRVTEDN